jgi:hypothetical protein
MVSIEGIDNYRLAACLQAGPEGFLVVAGIGIISP